MQNLSRCCCMLGKMAHLSTTNQLNKQGNSNIVTLSSVYYLAFGGYIETERKVNN